MKISRVNLIIRKRINEAELLIKKVTTHIAEYKDQSWEFKIQRKGTKESKEDWTTIASGTDISRIVDKNIAEGKSYVYRVMAINKNGKSGWSSEYNKVIGKTMLRPPSALDITSESNFRLVFSWNDNSNNDGAFFLTERLFPFTRSRRPRACISQNVRAFDIVAWAFIFAR